LRFFAALLGLTCLISWTARAADCNDAGAGSGASPCHCLDPLPPGQINPSLRDVTVIRDDNDKAHVTVQMCVTSNSPYSFQPLQASAAIFGDDHSYLNEGGEFFKIVEPIKNPVPPIPRMVQPMSFAVAINPSYYCKLSDKVMVYLVWQSCAENCPPSQTNTYLVSPKWQGGSCVR
jgi:hypothetical protein